LKLYKNTQIYK